MGRISYSSLIHALVILILILQVSSGSEIHEAVYASDIDRVRLLIESKPELIELRDESGFTAFELATFQDKQEIAGLLLSKGAKATVHCAVLLDKTAIVKKLIEGDPVLVNCKGMWGNRPLHSVKSLEVARVLLDSGASVDVVDDRGLSPLHVAGMSGRWDIAELLIARGALEDFVSAVLLCHKERVVSFLADDPSLASSMQNCKMTALQAVAVSAGKNQEVLEEIVELLIGKGANVNQRDEHGFSVLHWATNARVVKVLLEHGGNVNARGANGWTPLHTCRSCDVAELLIAHGANVNAKASEDAKSMPLHKAIQGENDDLAVLLIENGADIDYSGEELGTPLHIACEEGRVDVVKLLIARGANVNSKESFAESSPLHEAKNKEIAQILLDNGADINLKDGRGKTALYWAAVSGDVEMVKFLRSFENRSDKDYLLRMAAVSAGQAEVAKLLAEKGRPDGILDASAIGDIARLETLLKSNSKLVFKRDHNKQTPLHRSVDSATAELLIQNGADVNAKDISDKTPLHIACQNRRLDVIEVLLAHKADVNARCSLDQTPLHEAVSEDHFKAVELLIEHGADVNADSANGTPLFVASNVHSPEITKLLVKNGANVNRVGTLEAPELGTSNELSAELNLFYAVLSGMKDKVKAALDENPDSIRNIYPGGQTVLHLVRDFEVATLLVHRGADLNVTDDAGRTPLQCAVFRARGDIVELMIDSGADVDVYCAASLGMVDKVRSLVEANPEIIRGKNCNGFRVLHAAVFQPRSFEDKLLEHDKARPKPEKEFASHIEIIEFLLSHGIDINAREERGLTALHLAAMRDDAVILRVLIERGAEIDSQTKTGETALHFAAMFGRFTTVQVLIDNHADISIKDVKGQTAYDIAEKNEKEECAELLKPIGGE